MGYHCRIWFGTWCFIDWSWCLADEQAANQVTSASTPESVSQNPDFVVTETTVDGRQS